MMECKEFSKYMGDYVDGTLSAEMECSVKAHLGECECCSALVKELETARSMVQSLNQVSAPIGFEERLKARIAAEKTAVRPGFLQRLQSALRQSGQRAALRPALGGLAFALALGVFAVIGQFNQPEKPAVDWAYIETMQEQHSAFASANPLADSSAMMLKERAKDLGGDL